MYGNDAFYLAEIKFELAARIDGMGILKAVFVKPVVQFPKGSNSRVFPPARMEQQE
jgi:hypothetical protein